MTVLLKRSFNSGEIPNVDEVDFGEVAINVPDGKIFLKTSLHDIVEVGGQLERIQDGSNIGWRIRGRNPATYDSIGNDAVDFSRGYFEDGIGGATGTNSFASGYEVEASGEYSSASGFHTSASGINSIASGESTSSESKNSSASGFDTVASGLASHAEGSETEAKGDSSHSEGKGTIAQGVASNAQGMYNTGTSDDTIHETGIGTWSADRKNAFEIYRDGRVRVPELSELLMDHPRSLVTKEVVDTKVSTIGDGSISGSLSLGDGVTGNGNLIMRAMTDDYNPQIQFRRQDNMEVATTFLNQAEDYNIALYDPDNGTTSIATYIFGRDGNVSASGIPSNDNHLVNKKYVDKYHGELIVQCLTSDDLKDYVNTNPMYGVSVTFELKNDVTHTWPVSAVNIIQNSHIKIRRLDANDATKPELIFEYNTGFPYVILSRAFFRVEHTKMITNNLSATDALLSIHSLDGKMEFRDCIRSDVSTERELSTTSGNIILTPVHSELYIKNCSFHGMNIGGYNSSYVQLVNSAIVTYEKGHDTCIFLFNRSHLEINSRCTLGGGDTSNLNNGISLNEYSTMDYSSGGNIVFLNIETNCFEARYGSICNAQSISGDISNIGPAGFVINQRDAYGSMIFDNSLLTHDVAYNITQIEAASDRALVTKEFVEAKVSGDIDNIRFTDLSDTPGAMGPTTIHKWLRVDSTGTTLEYVDNVVGAQEINELNDVDVSETIGDGDHLVYDNSDHMWKNTAQATISTWDLTDFKLVNLQEGDSLVYDGNFWVNTSVISGGTF